MNRETFQNSQKNAIKPTCHEVPDTLGGEATVIAAREPQEALAENCLNDQELEELVESFWDDKVGRQELLATPKRRQNPNVGGNFIKTEPSKVPGL